MKTQLTLFAVCILLAFSSCKKAVEAVKDRFGANSPKNVFVEHVIAAGQQNSNQSGYRSINAPELKFVAKFDNSAVYHTVSPENQSDINKLYGFSDNNQEHHINSARIGWRWDNNQLELLAYVYNNGVQSHQFITTSPLNQEINCSIRVTERTYVFNVNGTEITMPRVSTTAQAAGYILYPFFGGDEMAPQDIHIWVKDL